MLLTAFVINIVTQACGNNFHWRPYVKVCWMNELFIFCVHSIYSKPDIRRWIQFIYIHAAILHFPCNVSYPQHNTVLFLFFFTIFHTCLMDPLVFTYWSWANSLKFSPYHDFYYSQTTNKNVNWLFLRGINTKTSRCV